MSYTLFNVIHGLTLLICLACIAFGIQGLWERIRHGPVTRILWEYVPVFVGIVAIVLSSQICPLGEACRGTRPVAWWQGALAALLLAFIVVWALVHLRPARQR